MSNALSVDIGIPGGMVILGLVSGPVVRAIGICVVGLDLL
jgi:hypothetical protein